MNNQDNLGFIYFIYKIHTLPFCPHVGQQGG